MTTQIAYVVNQIASLLLNWIIFVLWWTSQWILQVLWTVIINNTTWLHILLIHTLSSQKLKPRQTKFAEAILIAVRETDNGKWLLSKLLL
jgi:Flp pilus assembly protein TadB